MDNKQDRQFLWNVKDFLTKSPILKSEPKRNSLKDTIRNVTALAQPVAVPVNEIVNQSNSLKNQVTSLLNAHQSNINKQKPNSIKSSNHISANIFNLTEAKDKEKKTDYTLNAFLDTETRYRNPYNTYTDYEDGSGLASDAFPWTQNYMGSARKWGSSMDYLSGACASVKGTYVSGGTGYSGIMIPGAGATAGVGKKVSPGSSPSSGGAKPKRP